MLAGLDSLNELVEKPQEPTDVEMIYYLFWEKGIGLKEFNNLPLPYIFSILRTFSYVKEQEEKEMKKAQRKR